MKVLFIADIVDKYGATDSLMQLIDSLHDVCNVTPVLLISKEGRLSKWASDKHYEYYCVGYKPVAIDKKMLDAIHVPKLLSGLFIFSYSFYCHVHELKAIYKCSKIIDFSCIDIIHTNTNRIKIGHILSKKYKIPHVWHVREFGNYLDYDLIPLCNNYYSLFNFADKVIYVSKVVSDCWDRFGVDKCISTWIWDGIVSEQIERKRDILSDSNCIKVVMSGFIRESKGQDILVRALSYLPDDLKEKIFVDFYGDYDESYLKSINEIIHMNNLETHIRFHGYVENVNCLYGEFDIGVMCSNSEALGRVTIDYMNNGCLVIASDSGSSRELINDGTNGYLFKQGDAESLSNILKKAIADPDLSRIISSNGMTFARQNFKADEYAMKIYDIYMDCLDKQKAVCS